VVVQALIEPALVAFLWSYAHTKFASRLMSSGDKLAPNTPTSYGDPAFDGLLEYLRPRLGRGDDLTPNGDSHRRRTVIQD
jgi:hypothetical protein